MNQDSYRISVQCLENGYTVEVPDMEEIKKKQAEAKKNQKGSSVPYCYIGDCTKKYAAKSVAQVLKLVKEALSQLPDAEYDAAFSEASAAEAPGRG